MLNNYHAAIPLPFYSFQLLIFKRMKIISINKFNIQLENTNINTSIQCFIQIYKIGFRKSSLLLYYLLPFFNRCMLMHIPPYCYTVLKSVFKVYYTM